MFVEPIYIPRALNTGTCIQQGDLSILQAYAGTGVSHSQHRKKLGKFFWKNADEWTGRVEISKEEIPGSKRSMYGHILTDLLQALKGECLSSVFSTDEALISASAAPHWKGMIAKFSSQIRHYRL